MSKKEKDVELIPNPPSGWKVKHGVNEGNGPNNYPKVEFAKDSGPHLVVFKIPSDQPGTFNADNPMQVQPGTTSPSPTQPMDAQIADWQIFDGGKTLVILDLNSVQGDLSYRVKADGYVPVLDPIIRNGGTTITPPSTTPSFTGAELVTAGLALLVAFIVGFYVHRQFFAPRGVAPTK